MGLNTRGDSGVGMGPEPVLEKRFPPPSPLPLYPFLK